MRQLSSSAAPIQTLLLDWYDKNKRTLPWRDNVSPYGVWVSEVMLQQTQVKTVIPYYLRFMAQYQDVYALSASPLETVLKSWEGLGYYARARNLHTAAGIVASEMNGEIPRQYSRLIALPGVGDYIASAVTSIAFNHAHAVVDGNVKRVLARLFCMDTPVNDTRGHKPFKETADRLLHQENPGKFNQALMELGALICTPKSPACCQCPLSGRCTARAQDLVNRFPVRILKKKSPTYHITVGGYQKGRQGSHHQTGAQQPAGRAVGVSRRKG